MKIVREYSDDDQYLRGELAKRIQEAQREYLQQIKPFADLLAQIEARTPVTYIVEEQEPVLRLEDIPRIRRLMYEAGFEPIDIHHEEDD